MQDSFCSAAENAPRPCGILEREGASARSGYLYKIWEILNPKPLVQRGASRKLDGCSKRYVPLIGWIRMLALSNNIEFKKCWDMGVPEWEHLW